LRRLVGGATGCSLRTSTCGSLRDIAGNRDPQAVLRGCEGPRLDATVASDPVAPSHFSRPPVAGAPSALAGQRIPPYWRGARVELRQRRFQRVYTRQGSRAITGGRLAQQLHDSREFFLGKLLDRHAEDIGMAEPQEESEVERVIVAAIYRHARGNVIYLARAIVADLREAGFEIRRADAIPIRRNPGG
jgi:hypothetical protein